MSGEREWGVFRLDTGAQVGIGTTENEASAREDFCAWERDGYPVELRVRDTTDWRPADAPDRSPAPDAPQEDGLSLRWDEREALARAKHQTWHVGCSGNCGGALDDAIASDRVLAPAVERILADRLAARDRDHEAEVERLKGAAERLGSALAFWKTLALNATDSHDVIDSDGDGDWQVVADRMAAYGAARAVGEEAGA